MRPKTLSQRGVLIRAAIQTLFHNSLKEVTCFGISHSHIRNRTIEEVVGWNNCRCICLSTSADCNKIVTKCAAFWSRLQGKHSLLYWEKPSWLCRRSLNRRGQKKP